MQISATRHSSRISTESTASLASFGTGSGVLAVVTGTAGVSGGSICDESGNAATTIDSGLSEAAVSEAAVVSVAVAITGSVAVATSALATAALAIAVLAIAGLAIAGLATAASATAALPIAVACGATASSVSAVTDGARRSSTGTAAVISMPAEPKPASEAATQPARTTVPQDAAATVANRRAFMIPSPPPEQYCQPSMGRR